MKKEKENEIKDKLAELLIEQIMKMLEGPKFKIIADENHVEVEGSTNSLLVGLSGIVKTIKEDTGATDNKILEIVKLGLLSEEEFEKEIKKKFEDIERGL